MSNPLQARIEAAAEVTGQTVGPLLSHLGRDVAAKVGDLEVSTNADARAIGVSVSLVADAHRDVRLKNLANAISASQALQRSAAVRSSKVMRVERGIGPKGGITRGLAGAFSTVYHLEPRPVADDLAVVREVGIPAGVGEELSILASKLGMTATTLRVTVYAGTPIENMQIELGAPAPADVLDRLGDTGEAGRFLRALEPSGIALVWIGATPTGMLPSSRLEYLNPEFDEAVAMGGKFGDLGQLQSFFAALDSSSMASVAITLGASPLGAAWLSANVAT